MNLKKKTIKALHILAVLLLSGILILNVCTLVFIETINNTLLSPGFIEREMEKLGVYKYISEVITDSISEIAGPIIGLNINSAFSEAWVKNQSKGMLNDTLKYLTSETDTLNLSISTQDAKNNLIAQAEGNPLLKSALKKEINSKIPTSITVLTGVRLGGKSIFTAIRVFFSFLKPLPYLFAGFGIILIIAIALLERDLQRISAILAVNSAICTITIYGLPLGLNLIITVLLGGMEFAEYIPLNKIAGFLDDVFTPAKHRAFQIFLTALAFTGIYLFMRMRSRKKQACLPGAPHPPALTEENTGEKENRTCQDPAKTHEDKPPKLLEDKTRTVQSNASDSDK